MKIKTSVFGLCGILVCAPVAVMAEGKVEIYSPGGGHSRTVNQVKDLRQLVNDPAFGQYQPGMVIATPAATRVANQELQQTLTRLRSWASREEGERAAAINQVIAQLREIKVTGRQLTSLDPAFVNNNDKANRTLSGEYSLYQASEASSVTLLGPVSGAGALVWQPGRQVSEYLDRHDYLSGAEPSQVTVIDPDGAVRIAPVDYWNRRHVEPQPGSIILVAFASSALPAGDEDLNQKIISVLTQRMPN
ncbi:capsule biosynthesis GfcC family protein [Klebsiella pneumoniae]|uniref:capsule biosynthesis GfcC family protein n=1 Tax=Klebsiella pneumoniae TaxID=573 RepID=UPI001BA104E8|nr:capsule biosynthesis GfcC family protein [Klebsiella pneumoniae]MBR8603818.1 capsule biosynthesis GfcC family protein [Klebsiella pneumoniae subsp. pneumoniae]MCI8181589.1 capsule biosynthesis GfcC family protein [Klebsiella pneumoniae]MCP6065273.1 capsule biosynthesis GfcC family protein [Klebsiella pneumoniae]MCP6209472.1 capsule biosynthesis GfcC family protein [Klebsiella pneumoniae]WLE35686.1 capsule biosynthesis GfcC family protein [Klebsiella pneumoniae]